MRLPSAGARWMGVTALALGVAVALGAVFGRLTRAVYPVFLVPVAVGIAVGALVGFGIHVMRLRSRAGVAAVTLAAWLGATAAFHRVEMSEFVAYTAQQAAAEGEVPSASPQESADRILEKATGAPGFVGFLRFRVQSGVGLRFWPSAGRHPAAALVVWGLELALGAALALSIADRVRRRIPAELSPPETPV